MLDTVRNAWAQILTMLLGLWLMAAPAVLGYSGQSADAHRILGPITAAFGLMAIWGHMRPLRWTNLFFGALLVLVPFVVGFGTVAAANSVLIGIVIAVLAFVRGTVEEAYGGGWSSLWTGAIAGSDDDWLTR